MKLNYLLFLVLLTFSSCNKQVNPTKIVVEDPIRHYYPILEGTELDLEYKIYNAGESAFIITDVQSSCGCIVSDNYTAVIPSKKEGAVRLKYTSDKNVGYVSNQIRIYGNMLPDGVVLLEFDINVVPSSGDILDYEEKYQESLKQNISLHNILYGDYSYKRYYVDNDFPK
ncbi:MAG: DUF1573 domain-containing protein [Phocaeicola sp.]